MQNQSMPSSLSSTALPLIEKRPVGVGRACGVAFGAATQLFFLYTVVYLFLFLRYGGWYPATHWFWKDTLLAVFFAVPHSVLLAPATQKWLKQWIPGGLLGCIHCCVTCASLLVIFHFWGTSSVTLWKATGVMETIIVGCFYGSWIALFYSIYLTGMGYQTGLTQWWYWMIRKPLPKREFVLRSVYRWMRHPIYMSFLGLIWFTPNMTLDHALLTGVWTAYIYVGSYLKDKRMIRFVGKEYREYAARVPGLPIIGFGPLLKMK
jgi:methanethiol S-methyltransferase